MKLIVKTLSGVEPLLSSELATLGASQVTAQRKAVTCEADWETLYKICYRSRLSMRVMVCLAECPSTTLDAFEEAMGHIAWEEWIAPGRTVAIDHVSFSDALPDSDALAERLVEAATNEMLHAEGAAPHFGPLDPDYLVNIHATDERICVGLDCTGEALCNRGYRPDDLEGASNEVMCAALLDLTGWTPDQALVDPMCGAGTICIEAAMKARHIPAQYYRKYGYCFEHFRQHNAELWKSVKASADAERNEQRFYILGADIDTDGIDVAKLTTLELKLTDVRIIRRSLKDTERLIQDGIVLTCPPFEAEATKRGLPDFYKEASHYLSHNFPDYDVWIYSPSAEAMEAIPFEAEAQMEVLDGLLRKYPF